MNIQDSRKLITNILSLFNRESDVSDAINVMNNFVQDYAPPIPSPEPEPTPTPEPEPTPTPEP